MNPNRMSIQELIDLKPSMDNPIELVCDDEYYKNELFRVKVTGIYKDMISIVNNKDMLEIIHEDSLWHYPSFDQPKKRNLEVFYECIGYRGITRFLSQNGKFLGTDSESVITLNSQEYFQLVRIPNGRKLIYDHDSKELLAWDEELLK